MGLPPPPFWKKFTFRIFFFAPFPNDVYPPTALGRLTDSPGSPAFIPTNCETKGLKLMAKERRHDFVLTNYITRKRKDY